MQDLEKAHKSKMHEVWKLLSGERVVSIVVEINASFPKIVRLNQ